jgi:predicted nucleic acid-binding protein
VTASKVLFDTSAWWEVLQASAVGASLQGRYLDATGIQVLTSAIALGELSAKLSAAGAMGSVSPTVSSIRRASVVVDLTGELAVEAGILRTRLQKRSKSASLADGIVLATARDNGARLVSNDRAFAGEPDVSSRGFPRWEGGYRTTPARRVGEARGIHRAETWLPRRAHERPALLQGVLRSGSLGPFQRAGICTRRFSSDGCHRVRPRPVRNWTMS